MMQRKPPAKRAFTGMVGLPPEPAESPVAPAAVTEPVSDTPKKRGRPAKAGKAMTVKERVAKHRLDKERRDLVAQLLVIQKRMLPYADRKSPQANAAFAERRLRLQKMRDEWVLLPVEELRKTLAVYLEKDIEGRKLYVDSRGRLSGESSGEADRKGGMSGTERQIAAAEGQQHVGHDDDSGKGKGGDASVNYNTESDGPSERRPPRGSAEYSAHVAYLENREAIITYLIKEHVRKISLDDDQPAHRCLVCGAKIAQLSDARQHFWVEYDKGLQMYFRFKELSEDPGVVELAPFIVRDAQRAYEENKHLRAVWTASRAGTFADGAGNIVTK